MTTLVTIKHPLDAHMRLKIINVDPADHYRQNGEPTLVERGDTVSFYVHSHSAYVVAEAKDEE